MENEPTYTEKGLLQAIAAGDEWSFASLFQLHKQMVYNVAWAYTEDKSLSEDILQDSFVIVWKNRGKLPEIQDFKAYLYVIARNGSLSALRKQVRERNLAGKSDMDRMRWVPEQTVHLSEARMEALLAGALAILSPRQRKVFELSRMEGQSREQIAAQLGISKNTVSVHLTIALRTVRSFLLANIEMTIALLFFYQFFKK